MDSEITANEEKIAEFCNDPFWVFMILSIFSAFPGKSKNQMKSLLDEFKEFCNEREQNRRENDEQNTRDSESDGTE